jgi:hypothetical protein
MGAVLVRISVNSYHPKFIVVEERESVVNPINYSLGLPSFIQTSCD